MVAQDNEDSEKLAVLLELKEVPGHPMNKYKGDEIGKIARFREWADKAIHEPDARFITLSIFCANYLPSVVEKFLHPPPSPHLDPILRVELQLNNVYFQMLWLLEQWLQPYWYKFLRSKKLIASNKKELTRVMVQRTMTVVPIWLRLGYMWEGKEPAHWAVNTEGMFSGNPPFAQLFWMLCGLLRGFLKEANGEDLLPPALKKDFLHHVNVWHKYPEPRFALGCSRVADYLTTEGIRRDKEFGLGGFAARRAWYHCGVDTCNTKQTSPAEFKICGRCRTVRYCSEAHQKQDWKAGHKHRCFETTY